MTFPPQDPSEPRLPTRRDPTDDPRRPALSNTQREQLYARLDRLQRKQAHDDPAALRPKRRRILRGIFLTWLILTAVSLAAILIAALSLRHSMRAALPQLDGTLHLPGLTAPVRVDYDPQAVPSLHASNLDDLLFAQGFVTAQDRLFQMDALRRHAAGELAEILGSSLISHDRVQRTLQMRAAADRAIAALPADQLHQLQAYANGVNAFISTHSTTSAHPDTLPVEFHFLHYHPAPWTPRDSLLVSLAMYKDLSTEFPNKINREILSAHLPEALLADLYPTGSWRDHPPTAPEQDLTLPREEIEQIPLDDSQTSACKQAGCPGSVFSDPGSEDAKSITETLNLNRLLSPTTCDDCRSGSNNWVISATHSATGAPLLSNDMHLSLAAPDIWYEAALHSEDPAQPIDVAGFTLPGVPFVIVGRNAHVAWGVTAMLADVQDLRIEHLRGTGSQTEFEHADGTWSLATHHTEVIRVRAGHDVSLDVLTTTHSVGNTQIETPILSLLYPAEHRALSLAWPVYDPANLTDPFLAIDTAKTGADLVQAFSTFGGPSLSLLYADEHHIGYHAVGRIPIRGPAAHYPRAVPNALPTPVGPPPADEESEPQGSLVQPHLFLTSYRHPARPLPPRPRVRLRPPPQKRTPDVPIVPATPAITYTIGSAISPVPVDALDSAQEWTGYVPYAELPQIVDPTSGILATANARVAPDDFPYHLANDWGDPYRVERINKLLTGRPNLKPEDMLAIQNDVHSEFDLVIAQRLAYALDHASKAALAQDSKRLHQAADLLRQWNGELTVDSPAATIVSATRTELWPMLLVPHIRTHDAKDARVKPEILADLYTWNEKDTALELLLQHTPARWLPPAYATWDDLLTAAVALGLHNAKAPANLATWQYGPNHPVEIAHPIFASHSVISRLLGTATGTGLQPNPGDGTTIHAAGLHFGPSERFTADLSSSESTQANITTGQSGNPASDHYLDQFQPWLRGTSFNLPLTQPATLHTLTLVPSVSY
jgi:penicillin amidase